MPTEDEAKSPPSAVADTETLLRHLSGHPSAGHVSKGKVHFKAFEHKNFPWEMSVDRKDYKPPDVALKPKEGCGLGTITAGSIRSIEVTPGLIIQGFPEPDEDGEPNPYHARVLADPTISDMRNLVCKELASRCTLIAAPDSLIWGAAQAERRSREARRLERVTAASILMGDLASAEKAAQEAEAAAGKADQCAEVTRNAAAQATRDRAQEVEVALRRAEEAAIAAGEVAREARLAVTNALAAAQPAE